VRHYAAILLFAATLVSAQAPKPPYLDPARTAEARARDLVSRMSLDQKVRQMQNGAPAIPELGVPAYNWWNEALHGVARAGQATVFPQAIGLAATWDTDLMRRVAEVISSEARAKYNNAIAQDNHAQYYGLTFWSPNINIFRDPRWGRGQETYGEDPFLTGRMAVEFIRGMQGDDPRYFKVIATAKHFAVHSGPEPTRHAVNITPSERDLNATYLPAFRAAMIEGKAYSLMCAYNAVNGVPACANTDLLQKTLRDAWGFNGYVVSDCGAVGDMYSTNGHHYKPTGAEATAAAVKAGTDLTCGREYTALIDAVAKGLISEADIDRSLERLFVARFRLGMFDPPEMVPWSRIPYSDVDAPAHRARALEAARKSIVLLSNPKGVLPLSTKGRRIAVIGPAADDPTALLGNYNGFSSVHVTPLEGIARRFGGANVRFALGATYVPGVIAAAQAPVQTTAFTHDSGAAGVIAEYFANGELAGAPVVRRVETRPGLPPIIDSSIFRAGVPLVSYSVRWRGALRAPVTGDYTFAVRGGAAATRFFLDGTDVLPAAQGRAPATSAPIHLVQGEPHEVRVEYRAPATGRNGNIQLMWVPPADALLAEAVDAVKNSDVTIAVVGLNPSLEGEEMNVQVDGFAGGDRTTLDLPAPQARLLSAAFATNKPVIIVLASGSAVAINDAAQHAAAVLAAWYGGEEAGTAIAETLAGDNNPGGRLPVTFYRSEKDLPPFEEYSMNGRTYRYFSGDALYGFGFGLSYSKFKYSRLHVARAANGDATVTVRVKNGSRRDGDEVVQVYLSDPAPAGAVRALAAFTRVHIAAGRQADVKLTIRKDGLPAGDVRISVGGGQPVKPVPFVSASLKQ